MIEQALVHLSRHDPVMKRLIAQYPVPMFTPHTNYYHELVDSIISQQLSVKAACTIEARFRGLFGDRYPEPHEIIDRDIEELRSVGLSRPKARYITDLAQHILDGRIEFAHIQELSNDEIIAELTQVNGIGEWTAHMFLLFCMARLDVLPVGDLGIRNAVTLQYQLDHTATPDDVRRIAAERQWHPYESVACRYLWLSLDNEPAV